ncbi:MAG: hypothetical protein IIA62_09040 [Nitrospinae bacterium]|nr:hypothetical protein [Nitrospinota bacterium]
MVSSNEANAGVFLSSPFAPTCPANNTCPKMVKEKETIKNIELLALSLKGKIIEPENLSQLFG